MDGEGPRGIDFSDDEPWGEGPARSADVAAVTIAPIHCSPQLASAKWDRDALVAALLRVTEPPGSIGREDAAILADAIIAATGRPPR